MPARFLSDKMSIALDFAAVVTHFSKFLFRKKKKCHKNKSPLKTLMLFAGLSHKRRSADPLQTLKSLSVTNTQAPRNGCSRSYLFICLFLLSLDFSPSLCFHAAAFYHKTAFPSRTMASVLLFVCCLFCFLLFFFKAKRENQTICLANMWADDKS